VCRTPRPPLCCVAPPVVLCRPPRHLSCCITAAVILCHATRLSVSRGGGHIQSEELDGRRCAARPRCSSAVVQDQALFDDGAAPGETGGSGKLTSPGPPDWFGCFLVERVWQGGISKSWTSWWGVKHET
jgi:hypothetical protein